MKKKIDIDQLEVGMYMEADVKESAKRASSQNVLLLGKGVLITSPNQIRRLKAAGLGEVTIDTTKGKDIDGGTVIPQVVVPQPARERRGKPLPKGREIPYRDELKVARATKAAVSKALKGTMESVALGGAMDKQKLDLAGKLITESVFRNVDAMVGSHKDQGTRSLHRHTLRKCMRAGPCSGSCERCGQVDGGNAGNGYAAARHREDEGPP